MTRNFPTSVMKQIIQCCSNVTIFYFSKKKIDEAARPTSWALKFIYRFLTFGSPCSVCLGPLKPRYRVPFRPSPWNEVMTAACCLHVIRALLLFRVHSRGSPNLLFSFCRKYSWLLATVSCTVDCQSAVLVRWYVCIQCSVVWLPFKTIELHTNETGWNMSSLERI